MKRLSIVIVNWNTRDFLYNALKSIYEEIKDIDAEIFVVDNASSNDSLEMVECDFPDVILIKNGVNVGFAAANNQAIREGKGKYFFLINPDTLILPSSIRNMLKFMEANVAAGAAGCIHLDGWGNKRYQLGNRLPSLLKSVVVVMKEAIIGRACASLSKPFIGQTVKVWSWLMSKVYRSQPADPNVPIEVDLIDGCGMMVRREVIECVGPLNEDYFHGGEDAEWCTRIKRAGWKLYIVNNAEIIHYGMKSYEKSQYAPMHTYDGEVKFFREKYGDFGEVVVILYKLSVVLSMMIGTFFNVPLYIISSVTTRKRIANKVKINVRLLGYVLGMLKVPK